MNSIKAGRVTSIGDDELEEVIRNCAEIFDLAL